MKPIETIGITVVMILMTLFGIWSGVGLGLTACVESKQNGITHKFFVPGTYIVCTVKEKT